jgi:hypothetical protein
MKKIIVIAASILFTALVMLGSPVHYSRIAPQHEGKIEKFHARVVDQQLILEFDAKPDHNLDIELYNLTGQRIESWKVNETSLTITLTYTNVLQQGFYIVKVSNGKSASVKKFKI